VVTGLLYVDPLATDLHTALNTSATSRWQWPRSSRQLCPGAGSAGQAQRGIALSAAGAKSCNFADITEGSPPCPNAPSSSRCRTAHVISLAPRPLHEAACVMTKANCGSVLIIDTP
jgi:hypothetical protein